VTADEAIAKAAIKYLPATYKRAIQYLEQHPADVTELSAHLGMTVGSGYKLLMALRELKVICIVEHRRLTIKGTAIRIWGLGEKHARPPAKKTPAERSKAWRDRRRTPTLGVWGL
jgi:hypothetical protein